MALAPLSERGVPAGGDGAPDVRGWDVVTLVDGEKAGEVHDVLIDRGGRARYLDVDLGLFRKHVLVPIGQARADPAGRVVWLPGFTRDRFDAIPAWEHRLDRLTRAYETGLAAAYTRAYAGRGHRPRPPYAGAVYGPSEFESPLRVEGLPPFAPLSRLPDHRIASDGPDPRGWRVLLADGADAGRVEDLVVDTVALKVSHLAVRPVGDGRDALVLVPVEYARTDAPRRAVWLDLASREALLELPAWDGRPPLPDLAAGPPDFYDHPRFSAARFRGGAPR